MNTCSVQTVAEHLFRLDAAEVAELCDTEHAFEMLLRAPLEDIDQPVTLLIDALDEADPAEQQVEGFVGNVKACGNKTLQLLLRHLVHLPESVRFVFTTRPDAMCGKVQDVLARAFAHSIQTLRPEQLRAQASSGPRVEGVMVYHTIVKECALSAAVELQQKSCPTMQDLYQAYYQVFLAAGASSSAEVRALLEVLLAAQEPLPQSLLQQMGLGALLQQLPGWGVLFFAREHRVYMVHKSLSDWLWAKQLRSSPDNMLKLDVSSGHLRLAVHLAKARASPSQYALKYLPKHLSWSVEHSSCKKLLDSILQDWDFMVHVMKAKCGVHWNRALGAIPKDQHTPTSYDTMRWLKLNVHLLEQAPSMRTFNSSACVCCPLGSALHEKAAASEQYGGFKCVQVLGRRSANEWQDTTAMLQVGW